MSKIKYVTANGEIQQWSETKDDLAQDGFSVLETSETVSSEKLSHFKIVNGAKTRKSDQEISAVDSIDNFDHKKALARMAVTFASRMIVLAPYLSLIDNLMEFKNFSTMKAIIAEMLQNNIVTQDDVNNLKSVLAEQSINLDSF